MAFMELNFTKMHGAGNDYIFVNCFDSIIERPGPLSVKLSDRHKGVGGDGLVMILRSESADAWMRIFNADGSEAGMCGNAIRCVAKYLYDDGIIMKTRMNIETAGGIRELCLALKDGSVTSVAVDMGPAELRPEKIPVRLKGSRAVSRPVTIGGVSYAITCVSMGNPHAVIIRDDLDKIDLAAFGPLIENDALFPDRVNVEFVEIAGTNRINMRVWERGSGETQACGTGACAAAVAAVLNGRCEKGADIEVRPPGGALVIRYTDETVFMTGDCVRVFDGSINI